LLGGHLDECKKPTPETYTGLTLRFPNPAETSDGGDASVTSDARSDEDTRERLEEDVREEIGHYFSWQATRDQLSAKILDFLDRQAAITERETRVCELYRFEENHRWHIRSLEEVNRQLNERIDRQRDVIDRQRDVIDRCRIAYNAVRGLFDDDSGAGRMA
jgi:hypothetical protein